MLSSTDELYAEQGSTRNKTSQRDVQEARIAREMRWADKEAKWQAREEKWAERAERLSDKPQKLSILEEKWDAIRERWDSKREKWEEIREKWKAETDGVVFDAKANTYTVSVGNTAAEINAVIKSAEAGATIILAEGTHEFTETLRINRDDITLKGESEEGTILNFTFPEGTGGNAIEVSSGAEKVKFTELAGSAKAGSSEITIADATSLSAGDATSLSAGDVIYLSQANTQEYLSENGWDNVSFDDADNRPFREVIVRIESIDGNTLTLSSPLPYDFDALETDIFHIDLLESVSLEQFTVKSGIDAEVNYNDFVNTHPEFLKTSVILVEGTDGTNISNISIHDAPSNAFDFRSTIDLTGDGLSVDGAYNLGSGGNGYGVQLYETFDATLTDLEIHNVRHSVLYSSWHAEAGNYIEIASTNRDVNFHGSPDANNTVIVQSSILEYDPNQHTGNGNGFWDIVSGAGSQHASTDIYGSNTVAFSHAEGSNGTETIYGTDDGAYLDGNGSQDHLIGGDGNDIIIGGASRDILTGGEGSDIFVFEVGDSFDTVTDFSGYDDGDLIWFAGAHDLVGFDDLTIAQNGEDADIVYGSSSKITLAHYDITALEAGFFVFDPAFDSEFQALV